MGRHQRRHGIQLRLRYRTDVIDADYAARIAGYHHTALAYMAADPDAEHHPPRYLVSEGGKLPARWPRGAAAAAARPPRARAVRGAGSVPSRRRRGNPRRTRWTYQQLNRHANQLARALVGLGLSRESVVAVVMTRSLDWMASVLAIFKAGCAQCCRSTGGPGRSHREACSRVRCRVVLTGSGSLTTLKRALDSLPDVQTVDVDAVLRDGPGRELRTISV